MKSSQSHSLSHDFWSEVRSQVIVKCRKSELSHDFDFESQKKSKVKVIRTTIYKTVCKVHSPVFLRLRFSLKSKFIFEKVKVIFEKVKVSFDFFKMTSILKVGSQSHPNNHSFRNALNLLIFSRHVARRFMEIM